MATISEQFDHSDSPIELTPEFIAGVESVAAKFSPVHEPELVLKEDGSLVPKRIGVYDHKRLVFHVPETDISFAFSGREELPIYPAMQTSRLEVSVRNSVKTPFLTSQKAIEARNAQQRDYQEYLTQMRTVESSERHIMAEHSLFGMYSLLTVLQPENPEWNTRRDAVEKGQYDTKDIELIDAICAVNIAYCSARNGQEQNELPSYGEVVVLDAILNKDPDAIQLVNEATGWLFQREEGGRLRDILPDKKELDKINQAEAIPLSDLAIVHCTAYLPEIKVIDGTEYYCLQSLHDATNGYPRASIHTTLNRTFDFEGVAYREPPSTIVLCPLQPVVEVNGPPVTLFAGNTIWPRNPGSPVLLPKSEAVVLTNPDPAALHAQFLEEMKKRDLPILPDDQETLQRLSKTVIEHDWAVDYTTRHATTSFGQIEDIAQQGRRLVLARTLGKEARRVAYASGMPHAVVRVIDNSDRD